MALTVGKILKELERRYKKYDREFLACERNQDSDGMDRLEALLEELEELIGIINEGGE